MISNVLMKWFLAIALVILFGATFWSVTQETKQVESGTQLDPVVDWMKELDRQQPDNIQTATFALG